MPITRPPRKTRKMHGPGPAGPSSSRVPATGPRAAGTTMAALYSGTGDGRDRDLARGHVETLVRLAAGYQMRESGIVGHLGRIHSFVTILAEEAGLDGRDVHLIACASLLHDVGMIDVPDRVVNKEGALDAAEQDLVRRHTDLGWAMLEGSGVPLLDMAATLARTHHERFDGKGYPGGLCGDSIPLGARMLGLSDVLDALTTDRPFKQAYPFEVAMEILKSLSGTHFDPAVVAAMERRQADFEDARQEHAGAGRASHGGFRMSARDMDDGRLFSIARGGYFSCPYCKKLHERSVDTCQEFGTGLREIHKLSGITLDGKYRLKGALGVGGMGTVYEAEHVLIGRRLAVKFLDPALAGDPEAVERFGNEARVWSTVRHPNLVEVTDMGRTAEGIPYIVMEHLEGTDLARLVGTNGRLGTMCAVTIALEILRTLDAVHAAGIVHRDLKPENVFLARSAGRVSLKLLDFGISRLIAQAQRKGRLTQKGVVFGTPQYMAPEQAAGMDEVDHRADLFTVGEILYEMLTGACVFDGENSLAVLSAVIKQPVRPPGEIAAGLPPEIEAILMKALEKDPADRWENARQFMAPLLEFASADPRFEEGALLDLPEEARA